MNDLFKKKKEKKISVEIRKIVISCIYYLFCSLNADLAHVTVKIYFEVKQWCHGVSWNLVINCTSQMAACNMIDSSAKFSWKVTLFRTKNKNVSLTPLVGLFVSWFSFFFLLFLKCSESYNTMNISHRGNQDGSKGYRHV